MMRLMRVRLMGSLVPFLAGAVLLGAGTVPAQETALRVDPAQTRVEFTLPNLLHTAHGTFQLKRGDLRFDPAGGKVSGELVVDATSGESGSGGRDKRMHNTILQSATYPEIVFRPDRVAGKVALQGKSEVSLHGMFSIHGATHEVTLPLQVEAAGGQYTATGTFKVPYVKWGMKNPSTLMLRVSDTVEITVHTVAR
jgi:polyisoprenoid-binding protein YceI